MEFWDDLMDDSSDQQTIKALEKANRILQKKLQQMERTLLQLEGANARKESMLEQVITELKESEERFRLVVEQTRQLIYDYDAASDQIRWEGAIQEITGYSPLEFKKTDVSTWLDRIHPNDRAIAAQIFEQSRHQGEHYHVEYRFRRADDSYIPLEDYGVCLSQGNSYRLVGAINDISELKQTQAQLVQQEKMSSLGQLVAGVAHEINNPVSFIYGNLNPARSYIQDLLRLIHLYEEYHPNPAPAIQVEMAAIDLDFLKTDLPRLLASIEMGAIRIKDIVLSLRTFSRLDEADFKSVDIHEGLNSTLVILDHRLKVRPNREAIQVIKSYGDLPPVACYPGQLNQVFMNILVNAIDALEELNPPQPMIHIRTVQLSARQIAVHIADNGPGIPDTIQKSLFDPFFTTKTVGKGTGLGLAIARQIIEEKHGGTISVTSKLGEGTDFMLKLPLL
jgi:PAS domain S-box-containing protein